ncbi:putative holin-like toxin [Sporosarcina sp. FSL K6-3457]
MMVSYEAINMLLQAFIAFATMATAITALIVLFTNKKK